MSNCLLLFESKLPIFSMILNYIYYSLSILIAACLLSLVELMWNSISSALIKVFSFNITKLRITLTYKNASMLLISSRKFVIFKFHRISSYSIINLHTYLWINFFFQIMHIMNVWSDCCYLSVLLKMICNIWDRIRSINKIRTIIIFVCQKCFGEVTEEKVWLLFDLFNLIYKYNFMAHLFGYHK